jgi:hypothetical protein
MKWLFFLLLLINIGLFVWIYPQQPQSQPEPTHLPGVKRLVLLSEARQAAHQTGQLPDTSEGQARESAQQGQSARPAQSEPSLAGRPAAEATSDNKDASQSSRDSEFQPQMRDQSFSQTEPARTADIGAPGKPAKPHDGDRSGPPRQCRRIGPLEKRNQVDKLSLSLMAMGIQTDLQIESTDEQEGYWVMIPPQANREAAMAVVKRLREAGITDLWRFTSGSFANAISLGLFRNESRAEIRLKAIAAKGFDAEVRPRYRQKNTYWLSFSFTGDSPLSETDWNSIAEIYPGVELNSVACTALIHR